MLPSCFSSDFDFSAAKSDAIFSPCEIAVGGGGRRIEHPQATRSSSRRVESRCRTCRASKSPSPSKLPVCFVFCQANSEMLPNVVSRPVESWRTISVAPGALSSAPFAPPPRPPRPPPRPAGCRAASARGCRCFWRIVAHGQPGSIRTKREGLNGVDHDLVSGDRFIRAILFWTGLSSLRRRSACASE